MLFRVQVWILHITSRLHSAKVVFTVEVDFGHSSTGFTVVQVKVVAAGGESGDKDDNIHIKHHQAKETHGK